MPGQKSLKGRSLCVVYSLVRYATRRLTSAIRAARYRRVMMYPDLYDFLYEVAAWEGSLVVLFVGVKRIVAVT